jgi:hypothetical protein
MKVFVDSSKGSNPRRRVETRSTITGVGENAPSIDTSKWTLSDFVTTKVFTYLVLDDLNDCSGVCKFFYRSVADTVKFMATQGLFTFDYFAPSRVSYKLARVRVGIAGVHMETQRVGKGSKPKKSKSKPRQTFALTNVNTRRCLRPVKKNTLPAVDGNFKSGRNGADSSGAFVPKVKKRRGAKTKKTSRRPAQLLKENKVQTPRHVSSPPFSMSRVHFISKPPKLPSPPKVEAPSGRLPSGRFHKGHRRIVKRGLKKPTKPRPLNQFFQMLPEAYRKQWQKFKSSRASLAEYTKSAEIAQKLHGKAAALRARRGAGEVKRGLVGVSRQGGSQNNGMSVRALAGVIMGGATAATFEDPSVPETD